MDCCRRSGCGHEGSQYSRWTAADDQAVVMKAASTADVILRDVVTFRCVGAD
jgi:hypothetical protein